MQDFKHLHKPRRTYADIDYTGHPSILECIGYVTVMLAMTYGLMYLALVQMTGGF